MIGLVRFILGILVSLFRSKIRLEAETAVLRHQLIVLRCKLGGSRRLTSNDRCFFIELSCIDGFRRSCRFSRWFWCNSTEDVAGFWKNRFYYDTSTAFQTAGVLLSLRRNPPRLNWHLWIRRSCIPI